LIFLQIPNDFGLKLFVTALSGSQEMSPTLPPLVENPPAAAVNQDPCHTQIGKSKGSNDLWLCFDALGLCVLLGHWSIFFSWLCRKQLSILQLPPSMMRVFLLPWQQRRRELKTGRKAFLLQGLGMIMYD
jgi:hypothetical protein